MPSAESRDTAAVSAEGDEGERERPASVPVLLEAALRSWRASRLSLANFTLVLGLAIRQITRVLLKRVEMESQRFSRASPNGTSSSLLF